MSIFLECPYCEKENNITECLKYLNNENICDFECVGCKDVFEVRVEFEPSFYANEIVYECCEICGSEVRDIKKRTNVFPYPKTFKEDKLCVKCWKEGILMDIK